MGAVWNWRTLDQLVSRFSTTGHSLRILFVSLSRICRTCCYDYCDKQALNCLELKNLNTQASLFSLLTRGAKVVPAHRIMPRNVKEEEDGSGITT